METTILTIITSVAVALITGACSILSVVITSKTQHQKTIDEIKRQNDITFEQVKGEIKLVQKDITNLEDKVNKHNGVVERTYALERSVSVLEEKQKVANNRIDDLEKQ